MAHDRVWFAREAVKQLIKAQKMRRLYGRGHAHAASALSALAGLVRSFIKLHDTLAVEVKKDGLFVGDAPLLEDARGSDASFALALFGGGLRAFAFLEGVKDEELDRFLGVVSANPEDDLAVLFGREELPHIHSICIDELTEGWDVPENLTEAAQRQIDMLNLRAKELISQVESRRLFGAGETTFELSDTAKELEQIDKLGAQGAFDGTASDVGFIGVPEEALDGHKNALKMTGPDDVTKAVIEVVIDALVLAPAELPNMTARWFLDAVPKTALARGDLNLLAWILERYRKELTARTSKDLAPARDRLQGALGPVIDGMSRPEMADKLIDAVSGDVVTGTAAFTRIAEVLGPGGVALAVSTYIKTTNKQLREALNEYIAKNAELNPAELTRLCAPTVPVETAKWALFTASKQVKGQLAESLFAAGLQHPEKAVSDYANFLWRTHTAGGRLRAFMDALDAKDPAERVRAAETIGRSKDTAALEMLKKTVDDPAFLERTPEEKKAILGAIAAIGGAASAGFLSRQTERQTGLFRRRAGAEIREEAARLLENLKKSPPGGGAP